jgi:hypothetical protein
MQTVIPNPYEIIDFRLKNIETLLFQLNQNIESKEQPEPESLSNFIDINEFCRLHPKKPAKATVYSQISLKKIPTELIHKPTGTKKVLFYRDAVLQWIDKGMPSNAEQIADDYVNNRK